MNKNPFVLTPNIFVPYFQIIDLYHLSQSCQSAKKYLEPIIQVEIKSNPFPLFFQLCKYGFYYKAHKLAIEFKLNIVDLADEFITVFATNPKSESECFGLMMIASSFENQTKSKIFAQLYSKSLDHIIKKSDKIIKSLDDTTMNQIFARIGKTSYSFRIIKGLKDRDHSQLYSINEGKVLDEEQKTMCNEVFDYFTTEPNIDFEILDFIIAESYSIIMIGYNPKKEYRQDVQEWIEKHASFWMYCKMCSHSDYSNFWNIFDKNQEVLTHIFGQDCDALELFLTIPYRETISEQLLFSGLFANSSQYLLYSIENVEFSRVVHIEKKPLEKIVDGLKNTTNGKCTFMFKISYQFVFQSTYRNNNQNTYRLFWC